MFHVADPSPLAAVLRPCGVVAGALLCCVAPVSFAQDDAGSSTIVVTGSALARPADDGALPVQTITREEIARSGAANVEALLSNLAPLSSAGRVTGPTGAGNSTYGLSSVSLRGLGAARTLVLVNGRRLAAHAGGSAGGGGGAVVDIGAIPLEAIERIEILQDGASAVYGSDAVAGVVNVILRSQQRGVEVTLSHGTPTRGGGGQESRVALGGGLGDVATEGFNLTWAGSYERARTLMARDRAFASSGNRPPYLRTAATGQGNIEGVWVPGQSFEDNLASDTNPYGVIPDAASAYGNPLAAAGRCGAVGGFGTEGSGFDGSGSVPVCAFDSAPSVGLVPQREQLGFSGTGTFRLGGGTELFADALWSRTVVTQRYQAAGTSTGPMSGDAAFGGSGVEPALLITPANPNYAIAADYLHRLGLDAMVGQPLAVTARVFDFGPRTDEDTSTQSHLVAGTRGRLGGVDYEAAYAFDESRVSGRVKGGYFSQLAYARLVNDPASGWNPWSAVQTPALAAALQGAAYRGSTIEARSRQHALDLQLHGSAGRWSAGPLRWAGGLQWRREGYRTEPSAALASGDIAGLGSSSPAIDRGRSVASAYGELELPIARTLDGNLALRADRYGQVGRTADGKAALRWRAAPPVLLRASLGTGFRAPTLTELWETQVLGPSDLFNDPATGQTDLQALARSGGNPRLRPERSRQHSVGLVFTPSADTVVSADLFHVRIRDMVSQPSAQEVVSGFRRGDPAYAGLVALSPAGDIESVTTTLQNNGNATVQGIDVSAAWSGRLPAGRLELSLHGTYTSRFDQASAGGVVQHKVGTIVTVNGDPVIGAQDGGVVLRWKHQLSGTWRIGRWATTLTQNFTSGYETGRTLDGARHFIGDQALYDLHIAFDPADRWTLAAGVKNLLDKPPPLFIAVSNQFQLGYDITQFDPRGRFLYASATLRF